MTFVFNMLFFALFWILRLFCFLSHYVFAGGCTRVEVIGELAVVGSNFTGCNPEGPALKATVRVPGKSPQQVKPRSSFSI